MKNVFSYLVLALILVNCHESKESLTGNKFSKNVGQKIPNDVAERWANRFKKANGSSRINEIGLDINTLQSFLEQVDEKIGVSFHHALDGDGQHHILASVVADGEPEFTSVIDINGTLLGNSSAQEWTGRYKSANPGGVWSHFFGIHVFNEIISSEAEEIEFIQGINDQEVPQLLLYVWSDAESTGRSQTEGLTVYDKSVICPPDCGNTPNSD